MRSRRSSLGSTVWIIKKEFAMKVLLVNGSPHKEGCTYTALAEVGAALQECCADVKSGIETDPLPGKGVHDI